MTTGLVVPTWLQRVWSAAGAILPGAKLYFYQSGTGIPLNTFNNPDLAPGHENTNPVVAAASGQFGPIFLQPFVYRVTLTDSAGNVQPGFPLDGIANDDAYLAQATGAARVGYQSPATGSVAVTVADDLADFPTLEDFGATGGADDTAALTAAIAWGTFKGRPGRVYTVASRLTVTAGLRANFQGATLKLKSSFADSEPILINAASQYKSSYLQDLVIDFNGKTTIDGIRVTQADQFTFRRVRSKITAQEGRRLFYVDGSGNLRILDLLFDTCASYQQLIGWKFLGGNPQTTSFDCFALLNCQHTGANVANEYALYLEAYGSGATFAGSPNRVTLIGGDYENAGAGELYCDQAQIALVGAYLEAGALSAVGNGTVKNHGAITGSIASRLTVGNIAGQTPIGFSRDATSTILLDAPAGGGLPDVRTRALIGPTDGSRRYSVTAAARDTWGPPNYPTGKSGTYADVGEKWTDLQGIEWTCVKAGDTASATLARWCALGGEIRIPVDSTTLTNGGRQLNVQGDFEVESVELLVTTTFTGGTYYNLGNQTNQNLFLSQEQLAVANLVAGALISSRNNLRPTGQLLPPNGRYIITGAEFNATDASNLTSYVSGVFNAGAGLLIVRGKYITSPTTGLPVFGVVTGIPVPAFAPVQTVHFDVTEDNASLTYTCAVVVPPGGTLHDIQIDQQVLWAATGSATLKGGDTAVSNGYFTGVDLKATDLLVGEQLRIVVSELWGGRNGAYLVAATGQRGPTANNFGGYYAAGSIVSVVITVVTPNAVPTGKTHIAISFSLGGVGTVVKA